MKLSSAQQKAIVAAAAKRHGISPSFLWGVYGTETSFGANPSTSSTGATGYFQFEPATRRAYGSPGVMNFAQEANAAAALLATGKGGGEMGMVNVYYGAPSPSYLASVRQNAKSFGSPSGGGLFGAIEGAAGTVLHGIAEAGEAAEGFGNELGEAPGKAAEGVGSSIARALLSPIEEGGLYVVLVLAGLALIVYGVMVAVRPRGRALAPALPVSI